MVRCTSYSRALNGIGYYNYILRVEFEVVSTVLLSLLYLLKGVAGALSAGAKHDSAPRELAIAQ
jgi:hypothetical protein